MVTNSPDGWVIDSQGKSLEEVAVDFARWAIKHIGFQFISFPFEDGINGERYAIFVGKSPDGHSPFFYVQIAEDEKIKIEKVERGFDKFNLNRNIIDLRDYSPFAWPGVHSL